MKDAFYFPHFSNARNDRKLRRVRKDLGLEGYGAFFMLLEILRDEKEFSYPLADIDILSDEIGISEIKLRGLITSYDLFQTNDKDFFSLKFVEFLQPYIKTKARNRINGIKGNLIRYGHVTKEQLKNMSDIEILEFNKINDNLMISGGESGGDRDFSQSKVKESKRKESKVKEINTKEVDNKFKIFWTIYDKSVNKENTLIEWNKLDENTKDEILLYVPNYVKSKGNKRYQKDPLNFINDKTWNDEIIFKDDEVKKSTNKYIKDKYEEIY